MSFCIAALILYWVIPRAIHILHLPFGLPGNTLWWSLALPPGILIVIQALELWLGGEEAEEGRLLEGLKGLAGLAINLSTRNTGPVLGVAAVLVAFAVLAVSRLERDFLPPFNEGAVQVIALLSPGSSLATSYEIGLSVQ